MPLEHDDRSAFAVNEREADGVSRRGFLQVAGGTLAVAGTGISPSLAAESQGQKPAPPGPFTLEINGKQHELTVEPRVSLLDALREYLGLTGSKKGCDHGQCGACTVLVNGQRIYSCLTLAIMHVGDKITTIEGLATDDGLHPMQSAFIKHDAFQCGYCTPGQICSAVGLVHENHAHSEADIRELMSGNLCRCGAYPKIVAAVQEARAAMDAALKTDGGSTKP